MCGRFTLTSTSESIAEAFDVDLPRPIDGLTGRYNIAPTQSVVAIRADSNLNREAIALRWGLIPSWAKEAAIGNRMINARGETVAEKPAYRSSFKRKRCLVLADGFYEWQPRESGPKQPWYFRTQQDQPFAIAGLWARWDPRGEEREDGPIESCTLITTEANDLVSPVHQRMPVILKPDDYDRWLDPTNDDRETLQALIRSFDPEAMTAYPVSLYVNRPGNEGPECIVPVD